jgi:ethanolamine utilization protein EutA
MAGALEAGQPLVLALEADIGRSLGAILVEEFDVSGPLVCIDGLDLAELDYVDIGEILRPAGIVPVVVKSLVFPVGPEPFGLEGPTAVLPGAPRLTRG